MKQNYYYAELNDNNICIGVSCLKSEIDRQDMIRIDKYCEEYLWKRYENNEWSEEKFVPDLGIELTRMEELEQQVQALNIALAETLGM